MTNRNGRESQRNLALLLGRQVPRDRGGQCFDLHIVNVGRASACAASWRLERSGVGAPYVTPSPNALPCIVPPGADVVVACVDRSDSIQEQVDMIIRWAQPGGVVDESLHRFR